MLDAVDRAALGAARENAARALDALDILDPPSRLGLTRKETARYSLSRLLRAMALRDTSFERAAGFELECSAEIAKRLKHPNDFLSKFVPAEILERPLGARAMATEPGAKGGYLVGVDTANPIDVLRARSVAYRLGAQTLSGLTGNIMIPRQTGAATATWQGAEATSVTATDQTLGAASLTPRTVIALTDTSEQLIRQTSGTADAFIARDLASSLATALDSTVINGTGGAQPLGITNTSGVTTGQDAGTATLAKLLAFVSVAGTANAIGAAPGWVANTAAGVLLAGRQNFTGSSLPLWTGAPTDGVLTGYPAFASEQLASGNLIFGSWDSIVVADWGVLELSTSSGGTRFNTAQVCIRAMWMVDVLVRYPQAFVVATNLS